MVARGYSDRYPAAALRELLMLLACRICFCFDRTILFRYPDNRDDPAFRSAGEITALRTMALRNANL